jgi:outer membrane protein assembly factor BamA
VGGVRFANHEVDNAFAFVSGEENFVVPYIGARLERNTVEAQTNASVLFDINPNITDVPDDDLNTLGRLFADNEWYTLRWDAQQTFFLEPLLNRQAWADPSTPESSTLAHEVALRFRGQYALDKRLIPQEEQVAGGYYTVRGYPESVAVGDTVLLGTVEYRFHLPRALKFNEQPIELFNEPFRVVPQQPYGDADWDLILRAFFDIGRTINSERLSFERNETLIGAGVGVEFAFKINVNVRLDWGFALEDVEDEVSAGSSQVHIVTSIFF